MKCVRWRRRPTLESRVSPRVAEVTRGHVMGSAEVRVVGCGVRRLVCGLEPYCVLRPCIGVMSSGLRKSRTRRAVCFYRCCSRPNEVVSFAPFSENEFYSLILF